MKPNLLARRSGLTTRQMQEAPHGAVYVWVNSRLDYPVRHARALGRNDLEIVPLSWLDGHRWRGRDITGLVIDHAVVERLRYNHFRTIDEIQARVQWLKNAHSGNP